MYGGVMDPLRELLSTDERQTFEFFFQGLCEVTGRKSDNDRELMYVTSVLAHFAITSCQTKKCGETPCVCRRCSHSDGLFSTPENLVSVFDRFVIGNKPTDDADTFAAGGSKSLLLAGYFRRQMSRRHDVGWYDQVGSMLYTKASQCSSSKQAGQLYDGLAHSFSFWTRSCSKLQRYFYEERYLIKMQ